MGQYYVIANIDKQEYLDPGKLRSGNKLTEFSVSSSYATTAMMNLLVGAWH